MMKYFVGIILLAALMTACQDKPLTTPPKNMVTSAGSTTMEAPIDTAFQAATTSANKPNTQAQIAEYQEIAWEGLELPGHGMAEIMRKYKPQLDAISDNDQAAGDNLIDKLQAELNAAPVNPELNGKKIKISGFIAPLEVDEKHNKVKEFLLVPYFGACIHVPPPPTNQTLLIKPQLEHSLSLDQVYSAVTVTGVITTKTNQTKLASAGYQILDAKVEVMP